MPKFDEALWDIALEKAREELIKKNLQTVILSLPHGDREYYLDMYKEFLKRGTEMLLLEILDEYYGVENEYDIYDLAWREAETRVYSWYSEYDVLDIFSGQEREKYENMINEIIDLALIPKAEEIYHEYDKHYK